MICLRVSVNVLSGYKTHLAKTPYMFWEAKKPLPHFLRQMFPENIDILFHYLNSTISVWTLRLIFIWPDFPFTRKSTLNTIVSSFHKSNSC